jgi:membrane-bound serine protease (ClpP class)
MTPWLLYLVGMLLVFVEFYLPGAIMGICGGLFLFASIVAFAKESGSMLAIAAYVVFVGASVIALIKFAIWRIRSAKPEYSIYSDDSQVGYQASEYDHNAIGKVGIASTDLKPGGYIIVDGKRQQALSQAGYIVKGTEVIVVGGQEESLIVKLKKTET